VTYVSSERPRWSPPPPFERPKIEISGAGREWLWVYPEQIKKHDLIADFGLVQEEVSFDIDTPGNVVIKGPNGSRYFRDDKKIFAFTRPPD